MKNQPITYKALTRLSIFTEVRFKFLLFLSIQKEGETSRIKFVKE